MKKLMIIIFITSLIIGCKKKSTAPAPVAPSNNSTNNTTTQLTSQEQALCGYWIMDSAIMWASNTRLPLNHGFSAVYTNSTTCMMEFKSSWLSNTSGSGLHDLNDGHTNCSIIVTAWKAPDPGYFSIYGNTYPITLLTAHQLSFTHGDMSNGLTIYYLHK